MFVLSFFSDSRIVSHSPFACNWQNRFLDCELIITCFSSNTSGTSNVRIPRNSAELHPTPCICDMCHERGLGSSRKLKQNVLSLILLIPLAKLISQK